jgi:hypothetical protein
MVSRKIRYGALVSDPEQGAEAEADLFLLLRRWHQLRVSVPCGPGSTTLP